MQVFNLTETQARDLKQFEKTGLVVPIPGVPGLWLISQVVLSDDMLSSAFATPA